jgi:divalent metal cation (Fe/Co/Zn/Cd) transporter
MTAMDRDALVKRAFRLEWVTLACVLAEAGFGIGAGLAAGSITLTAFGLDSVIEAISAGVLLWRLNVEIRKRENFSEAAEHLAARIGGALLFALAFYVIASAAWSLWTRHGQQFSPVGLVLAMVSIPTMYWLARRKRTIAERINSRSLRADAMESLTCGYLAIVVLIGLLANSLTGQWWIDAVTSLAIVWFLLREGKEAWSGDECHHRESA